MTSGTCESYFFTLTCVCLRYLKHVVMKFICSSEVEALQLVRAISVLLELSPQEERHIKEYLDYKVPACLVVLFL